MQRVCRAAHDAGVHAQAWIGHMYENAWQVRGYEAFLLDLMTERDWAEYILDQYCANNLRSVEAAARAGYDAISIGDDVANQTALMFQPDLWREVMKPRWAKCRRGESHQAGSPCLVPLGRQCWAILDDLIEIGITILNPVQPECINPLEVRKRCGKHLAFDGCVGTQTTFPFGTPVLRCSASYASW